jgi:hypothetical protein
MGWLRSAALFFETVMSFVPNDSDEDLSQALCEFAEATKAWKPYRPTESTALLVDVPTERLDQAFGEIAKERGRHRRLGEFTTVIGADGATSVKDHVFTHGSKLSDRVRKSLTDHGLMLPEDFAKELTGRDVYSVDEWASTLVLSYIADRLAAGKGWTSITDNETGYVFNALHRTEPGMRPNEAEEQLVRVLVTELVPDIIETLPLDTYCELRQRYRPIREQLAHFINDVVLENRLRSIGDAAELRQAVDHCAKDLRQEVLSFRSSTFGSAFRKWGPFSLASLAGIAAPMSGTLALPLSGAAILLTALDKADVLERKATVRKNMIRLLASARDDVINSSAVKRLFIA